MFPDNSGIPSFPFLLFHFSLLPPPLRPPLLGVIGLNPFQKIGHYIENLSATEPLLWLELYKSDRVVDISLSQWLALTPPEIVAQVLAIPVAVVDRLKKEKQVLLKGREV